MKHGKEEPAIKESLDDYREQIRIITKSILDLSLARQVLSVKISTAKESLIQNIENTDVERKLVSAMSEYAKSIDLNEDLARAIVLDLIKFSKISQSESIYKKRIKRFLKSENITAVAVIGVGRMGGWFAEYFRDLGVEVSLYDDVSEKAVARAKALGVSYQKNLGITLDSDLVIISVPITKTPDVIRQLAKFVKKSSKNVNLIEISSVKNGMGASGLFDKSRIATDALTIYSIHPLFGVLAQPYERNSIVQVFPRDTTLLEGIFPQSHVVYLDWKDHDRLMGTFLTLPHALALIFGDLMVAPEHFGKSLKDISGPSFSLLLELSRRTLSENPDVYFEIQASNPNSGTIISNLISSVLNFQKVISDRADFERFFKETKEKIGD